VAQCVAVDRVGHGFVGSAGGGGPVPVNHSAPSISGTATQGQTLTEVHGMWLPSPTSYAYQWQRCDSAGANCVAITGASAQTYTLTAADVGSTIRVQETASNAAGPGVPKSSPQTPLVAAVSAGNGSGSGSGGNTGAKPDTVAPQVTGYRVTPTVFVVGGGSTPSFGNAAKAKRHKRHKKGTTFRYTLSEAATVKIVISQRASGRRKGKRCVAPTKKRRKAKKCTRFIVKGTLTRTSHQGVNSVAFTGKIGSKGLRPGRYQAKLTATDGAANTSKPKTISFKIVKR
jgi:hypothetical protein